MLDALRLEARVDYDLLRAHVRAVAAAPRGARPIVLNSLPKSGTHLAIKLLEQLPGLSRVRLQLSQVTRRRFRADDGEPTVDLGVVWPAPASRSKVYKAVRRVPRGAFITAHMPYDHGLASYLDTRGACMIVLTRDPRDVAVSSARYVSSSPSHPLYSRFAAMTADERLMAAIVGVRQEADSSGMKDLRERVISVTRWGQEPQTQFIRYEDLVGPHGGGSQAAQHAAIAKVVAHIGLTVSPADIERVAENLYGGTPTFRKGRTGAWRAHFGQAHLATAGPMLEDLLVDLGYEEDGSWWR